MERLRAEMGNPRFVGKGLAIEGTLTLKFMIDASSPDDLAQIEDLSALAEKVVLVTLEPVQGEMKFPKPPPKAPEAPAVDPRQEELIPKVWEVRLSEELSDAVESFWRFIADEAAGEIIAACLLRPFLPDADECRATSLRFTTPEKDTIVGYLATRARAPWEATGSAALTFTFVGDGEQPEPPWPVVGSLVRVPEALLAITGAEIVDGYASGEVVEIVALDELERMPEQAPELPPCEHRSGDMLCAAPASVFEACDSYQADGTCSPPVAGERPCPERGEDGLCKADATRADCEYIGCDLDGECQRAGEGCMADGEPCEHLRLCMGQTESEHAAEVAEIAEAGAARCLAREPDGSCVGVNPCEDRDSAGKCGRKAEAA